VIAPSFDPDALLLALCKHDVAFVVIGGWAAGVHGVGWMTFDLDVVVENAEANHQALARALAEVNAEFDTAHRPPILPDVERLRSATGALLFRTRFGRLDVLKEAGGETFATLAVDAVRARITDAHEIRIASLEAIARMKRAANRPKDQQALVTIEAALRKRDRPPDDE
jgi:hypothetical protein